MIVLVPTVTACYTYYLLYKYKQTYLQSATYIINRYVSKKTDKRSCHLRPNSTCQACMYREQAEPMDPNADAALHFILIYRIEICYTLSQYGIRGKDFWVWNTWYTFSEAYNWLILYLQLKKVLMGPNRLVSLKSTPHVSCSKMLSPNSI